MLGLLTLVTGLMTAYGYGMEVFDAAYAGGEDLGHAARSSLGQR